MAVRPAVADLLRRLRELVGDVGVPPVFADDALQSYLDNARWSVIRYPTLCEPKWQTGKLIGYRWQADIGDWDTDTFISDVQGNVPALIGFDLRLGYWETTIGALGLGNVGLGYDGNNPPYGIYVTGTSYDLYDAASQACEAWAAWLAIRADMRDASGAELKRSQMSTGLLKIADMYKSRVRARSIRAVRRDDALY